MYRKYSADELGPTAIRPVLFEGRGVDVGAPSSPPCETLKARICPELVAATTN